LKRLDSRFRGNDIQRVGSDNWRLLQEAQYIIDWNYDEDRSRIRNWSRPGEHHPTPPIRHWSDQIQRRTERRPENARAHTQCPLGLRLPADDKKLLRPPPAFEMKENKFTVALEFGGLTNPVGPDRIPDTAETRFAVYFPRGEAHAWGPVSSAADHPIHSGHPRRPHLGEDRLPGGHWDPHRPPGCSRSKRRAFLCTGSARIRPSAGLSSIPAPSGSAFSLRSPTPCL